MDSWSYVMMGRRPHCPLFPYTSPCRSNHAPPPLARDNRTVVDNLTSLLVGGTDARTHGPGDSRTHAPAYYWTHGLMVLCNDGPTAALSPLPLHVALPL